MAKAREGIGTGEIMAKHEVSVEVLRCPPGAAVKFIVKSDRRQFGTLDISKGSLGWKPPKAKKSLKMSWEEFDQLMQNRARGKKNR